MLKKIRKYSLCILFIFATLLADTKPAFADNGVVQGGEYSNGYINGQNNVVLTTNDKKRTSSTYYQTIMWTVTRCKPGQKEPINGAASEYFVIEIDVDTAAEVGNRVINDFELSYDKILNSIRQANHLAWAQEIENAKNNGTVIYLKFDAVMIIYDNNKWDGRTKYSNVGNQFGSNPRALQNARGWSAGARTGIDTHFNKYIQLPGTDGEASLPLTDPFVSPVDDWHVTDNSGTTTSAGYTFYGDFTGAPLYAGGNSNLQGYDASEGIPSKRQVTGHTEASPWIGTADIWARVEENIYNLRYLYRWVQTQGEYSASAGGVEEADTAEDAVQKALDELQRAENEVRRAISGLINMWHDTPLEHVFHHYLKVTYKDDAGNTYWEEIHGVENPRNPAEGATGLTVPESPDGYYTVESVTPNHWPYWWNYGYEYITRIKRSEIRSDDVIVDWPSDVPKQDDPTAPPARDEIEPILREEEPVGVDIYGNYLYEPMFTHDVTIINADVPWQTTWLRKQGYADEEFYAHPWGMPTDYGWKPLYVRWEEFSRHAKCLWLIDPVTNMHINPYDGTLQTECPQDAKIIEGKDQFSNGILYPSVQQHPEVLDLTGLPWEGRWLSPDEVNDYYYYKYPYHDQLIDDETNWWIRDYYFDLAGTCPYCGHRIDPVSRKHINPYTGGLEEILHYDNGITINPGNNIVVEPSDINILTDSEPGVIIGKTSTHIINVAAARYTGDPSEYAGNNFEADTTDPRAKNENGMPQVRSGFDVYIDKYNNICVTTVDKIKTSPIWYKTVGMTITRANGPGPHSVHSDYSYVEILINADNTQKWTTGGKEINVFKVPYDELLRKIRNKIQDEENEDDPYLQWYNELAEASNNSNDVYIKFDCVMNVYHGQSVYSGEYRNDPVTRGGRGDNYTGINRNGTQIYNAERWANPSGLVTHYNRYLALFGSYSAPDEYIYVKRRVTWPDHNNPIPEPDDDKMVWFRRLWKFNYTVEYKLTCILDREFWDDGYDDGYIKNYAGFQYLDPFKTAAYDLENVVLGNETYNNSEMELVFDKAIDSYMDIGKADLRNRQLTNFSSSTYYGNSIKKSMINTADYLKWAEMAPTTFLGRIPTNTYGEDSQIVQGGISSGTETMNDYLQYKNPLDKYGNTGIYLGNKDDVWDYWSRSATAGVVTGCDFRNATYMPGHSSLGSIMEGAGTRKSKYYYECAHSAAGNSKANPYRYSSNGDIAGAYQYNTKLKGITNVFEKLGSQTEDIRNDIANGAYDSSIMVTYKMADNLLGRGLENITVMPDTVSQLTSVTNSNPGEYHLYNNDPSRTQLPANWNKGQSFWGNCMGSSEGRHTASFSSSSGFSGLREIDKPSYETNSYGNDVTYIVDPVQIHTPIMSPGAVEEYDPDTRSYIELKRTSTATQLYNDESANPDTGQMRLDKWYFIRWKDLSEIGEEHRDISTPEVKFGQAGGYEKETDKDLSALVNTESGLQVVSVTKTDGLEEDEFTKHKYMKFPFEVYYNDGTGGRFYKANQWILIQKPRNEYGEDDFTIDAEPAIDDVTGEYKSKNHWVYTPIYIPTWAGEGLFEDIANADSHNPSDKDTCAQLKVEAINVHDSVKGKDYYDVIEELANKTYNAGIYSESKAAFVATFNVPVQLSGWIYDFTITGVSDIDMFKNQTVEERTSSQIASEYAYSFAANRQEKKTGLRNRLGENAVRYMQDATIARTGSNADWSSVNTVALVGAWRERISGLLHYGKSNYLKYMGALPKGNGFAYTVKTMSNMWNFNGKDRIRITPTFTYHKYNEDTDSWDTNYREHEELKVYYTEGENIYMPFGSTEDRAYIQKVNLGDTKFNESYYDDEDSFDMYGSVKRYGDWAYYNTYLYDREHKLLSDENMTFEQFKNYNDNDPSQLGSAALTVDMWLTQKIDSYCLSSITLPERLRLLSGEYDELAANIRGNGHNADESGYITYKDDAMAGSRFNNEYTTEHGSSDTFVIRATTPNITYKYTVGEGYKTGNPGTETQITKNVSMDDKFRASMQTWYGEYWIPEDLFVVDLTEHPEFRDFSDPHYMSKITDPAVRNRIHLTDSDFDGVMDSAIIDADGNWGTTEDQGNYKDYLEFYAFNDFNTGDGLWEGEDIFLQDGFLTIKFDILAIKDGVPHLVYEGGNNSMWKTQAFAKIPEGPDPDYPDPDPEHHLKWEPESGKKTTGNRTGDIMPPEPGTTESGVPTDYGDVVVVDLSKKFSDRFRAAIFNIN